MHDPRVGRFFAVDPLTAKYPHYTPYSFSGNKVIAFVELEGLEESPTPDKKKYSAVNLDTSGGDKINFLKPGDVDSETSVDFLTRNKPVKKPFNVTKESINQVPGMITDLAPKKTRFNAFLSLSKLTGTKFAEKFAGFFSSASGLVSGYDAILSIVGLGMEPEGGLKNLPVVGGLVGIETAGYEQMDSQLDNDVKWSNVTSSFLKLSNQDDINNVVLIYSYENMSGKKAGSISTNEIKKVDSRGEAMAQDYNFVNVGAQEGNNVFLLKTFKID